MTTAIVCIICKQRPAIRDPRFPEALLCDECFLDAINALIDEATIEPISDEELDEIERDLEAHPPQPISPERDARQKARLDELVKRLRARLN